MIKTDGLSMLAGKTIKSITQNQEGQVLYLDILAVKSATTSRRSNRHGDTVTRMKRRESSAKVRTR